MKEPVIIEARRLPIGRKGGLLSQIRPEELLGEVINDVLLKTKLNPASVEDVIVGCVTQAGEQGANLARLSALVSNLPKEVPGVTLNRMCGSSQQAIHFGAQVVGAGDADYVIAGGVESMSRIPMFSDIGGGFEKLGAKLRSKYEIIHQGESAERIAEKYRLNRAKVDEFSLESHRRAAMATQEGHFKSQIRPMEGKDKEGKTVHMEWDEGIRPNADLTKMMALPTVFRPNGVISAGNSSQISDGAAALLIADSERARIDGLKPRARFRARIAVGGDPTMQLLEVIPATWLALKKAGLKIDDIDVIEINEAFASVVLAWAAEMKPDMERVNPNGGAIAHGHPLGATGAVLMTKLLYELERTDKTLGLQVMCIGHGMATATIIERM